MHPDYYEKLDMMTRSMRHGCVHQMMSARARAYTNKLPRWPPQDDDLHNLSTANAFQISQSPLNPHKVSIIFYVFPERLSR